MLFFLVGLQIRARLVYLSVNQPSELILKPGNSTCIDNEEQSSAFARIGKLEGFQNKSYKSPGFITRLRLGLGSTEQKLTLISTFPYIAQSLLGALLVFAVFQPIFANGYQQQIGHVPSYWTDFRIFALLLLISGLLPMLRIIATVVCYGRRDTIRLYYHALLNVSTLLMILAVFAYLVMSTMGIARLPMLDQITVWILISPISLVILKLIAVVEES